MSSDENLKANLLLEQLLKEHEGEAIEEVFNVDSLKTQKGSFYSIRGHEKLKIKTIDKDKVRLKISSDLKLIPGIGEVKERILKAEGYETIEDLEDHPRFSSQAREFSKLLQASDSEFTECISGRCSNTHPHVLLSSSFQEAEEFLFLDIETMGLKNVPLILIGAAKVIDGRMEVVQYLLPDLSCETAVLDGFMSDLDYGSTFVTFNGRSFDLPFIRSRLRHHGIKGDLSGNHLDLLHFSRRTYRRQLPNCRLQTLEEHLFGIKRHDDVPSSMVPKFYGKYLETDNIGPLIPIVEHNKQDVITLARILSRLYREVGDK
jgi:uncharacterized protein